MVNIQVEGKQGQAQLLEQKQEKDELIEVATQMDMPKVDPIEIPTPSPDIKGNEQATKLFLTEAELVRKQTLLEKRRANAANARARRAEIRKARTLENTPDPMESISKKIAETVDKAIEANLKKQFPAFTPAPRNANVETNVVEVSKIAPTGDEQVIQQVQSKLKIRPLKVGVRRRPDDYIEQQRKRVKRFQSFFENISFNKDPIQTTATKPNGTLFF